MVFLFLIRGICEALRVKFEAGDERVKNEGAIIAQTIERIDGETTAAVTPEHLNAATLEHPAPVKV